MIGLWNTPEWLCPECCFLGFGGTVRRTYAKDLAARYRPGRCAWAHPGPRGCSSSMPRFDRSAAVDNTSGGNWSQLNTPTILKSVIRTVGFGNFSVRRLAGMAPGLRPTVKQTRNRTHKPIVSEEAGRLPFGRCRSSLIRALENRAIPKTSRSSHRPILK